MYKKKKAIFILSILGLAGGMLSIWFVTEITKPHSCSIFTAVQGDTVLFGDNFDFHEGDLVIGFYPASIRNYGSVHFGYKTDTGQLYSRVVNDQGLAWAVNSIPNGKLNAHPEKPYSHAEDNYFSTISNRAATVEEAIFIAKKFDFGKDLGVQIHIADASGDAVVIGPGADGEIHFTRKPEGEGYLLSTNFNLAIPNKGPVDFRWDTAGSMLDELSDGQALTPVYAAEILKAVHLKTLTTHTLFSNVFDLKNGDIYIYYMSQYKEAVKINISEQLALGQRVVDARDLFSDDIAKAGDASYHEFEIRFYAAIVLVILTGLACLFGGCILLVRKLKVRSRVDA